jgi:hypothetical protein
VSVVGGSIGCIHRGPAVPVRRGRDLPRLNALAAEELVLRHPGRRLSLVRTLSDAQFEAEKLARMRDDGADLEDRLTRRTGRRRSRLIVVLTLHPCAHDTLFERLTEAVEHRRDELGELVQEQHAVIRECHDNVP